EDEEVASTAGFYVTHNPPGGFTCHPPGRVHTLDPQSNVGYPPGEVVVDVSLNSPPSKGTLGFLELETKRVLGVSRRSLRPRDYRPHDSSDDHSPQQDPVHHRHSHERRVERSCGLRLSRRCGTFGNRYT